MDLLAKTSLFTRLKIILIHSQYIYRDAQKSNQIKYLLHPRVEGKITL